MASRPLHLGWFMNFTAGEWDSPMAAGGSPWDGKFYVDMAQALERACFDYIMIEDTLMVSEAYGDSAEAALKHGLQVPKHDPAPLAAMISAATSRLGVVATLSTLAYPPFMLARLCSTLDHIARRPVRLEHRHLGRGLGGAEFRSRQAAAARAALRDGR
ncbi:MAG: LLM class flavin-dependent oxidoreductase [Acetobacteraceae bacterium]